MLVLVTGAAGRLGSRLVPTLLDKGLQVRALVRHPERAEALAGSGADIVAGDLRNPTTAASAVKGVDAVVHLAAAGRTATPDETLETNLTASVELARAAARANVERFILTSTNMVYTYEGPHPAAEDDAVGSWPTTTYMGSKVAAEQALWPVHREVGLAVCVLRLAFVYGAGDPHLAEVRNGARVWPPHKRLHMVHHADVAQAVMLVTGMDGLDWRIYNVADDAPVTAVELLWLGGEAAPDQPASGFAPQNPWETIIDTRRIRSELGFRPHYPSVYTARDAGAL